MERTERTMVKIDRQSGVVAITTYNRKLGRKGRFLIDGKAIDNWFSNTRKPFVDRDINNRLTIWESQFGSTGRIIYVLEFLWLSESWNGELRGYKQIIRLDACEFEGAVLCEGKPCRLLDQCGIELDGILEVTERARAEVAKLPKAERRAFAKAVWKLKYPNEFTTLYADGKKDFFFRCASGMCGGLVLHEDYHRHGGVYYGVHT